MAKEMAETTEEEIERLVSNVDLIFDALDDIGISPGPTKAPHADVETTIPLAAITAPEERAPTPDQEPTTVADTYEEPAEETGPWPQTEAAAESKITTTLRVDTLKVDTLLDRVGELVVTRSSLAHLTRDLKDIIQGLIGAGKLDKQEVKEFRDINFKLSESSISLGRVTGDLQTEVMKIRMVQVGILFNRFRRLVRDQAADLGKDVTLKIVGEDTELDKRVVEQMSDPLAHILRNCLVHGLETPAQRKKLGKPETGQVTLQAYHESNHVVIEVQDDGHGIDTEAIRTAVVKKRLISATEAKKLSSKDLIDYIFIPGISAAKVVSQAAGRGVGMDVVKENVKRLGGDIEVFTTPNVGTRFIIRIPLTLAIIQALVVQVKNDVFTIPLSAVDETIRINREDIKRIEGVEVIHLRDTTIPLIYLAQEFHLNNGGGFPEKAFVVITSAGFKEVGLVVDEFIGQWEVVIKPLGELPYDNQSFSGATVLGDGRISLIIDVNALVNVFKTKEKSRQMPRLQ
ncbi:MAG: chemotaxis protein CheA [Deltaproteobacteria bacterium]|nr:chemotaxis protein CheA [Deltaproteobacteria bacterium]